MESFVAAMHHQQFSGIPCKKMRRGGLPVVRPPGSSHPFVPLFVLIGTDILLRRQSLLTGNITQTLPSVLTDYRIGPPGCVTRLRAFYFVVGLRWK